MIQRGDVLMVAFPYTDGRQGKHRPAVVVQCDRNNRRLANTLVAGDFLFHRSWHRLRPLAQVLSHDASSANPWP